MLYPVKNRQASTDTYTMLSKYFLILLILLQIFPAASAQAKPRVLLGAEIELVDRNLSNLVDYFDFADLQNRWSQNIKSDHYRDYLLNEKALERLPLELRQKLMAGLQLEKIDLAMPGQAQTAGERSIVLPKIIGAEKKETGTLISPAAKPMINESQNGIILQRPDSAAALPARNTNTVGAGIVQVPRETSWQELYARWQALPYSERAKVVDWELLSKQDKARILIELYNQTALADSKDPLNIKLKSDAPAVLNEFRWSRDGKGVLEFRHKKPLEGIDAFQKSFTELARISGTSTQILQPHLMKNPDAILHIHFSFPDQELTKDLRKQTTILEKILLLEGAANGDFDRLLDRNASVRFQGIIEAKGLLRLVDYNHLEIRYFPGASLEKLKEYVELFALPTEEAVVQLEKRLTDLHPEKYIEKIIDRRPDLMESFLTKEQRDNYVFPREKIQRWLAEDRAFKPKPSELVPPRLVNTTFYNPFKDNPTYRAYQMESLKYIVENSEMPEQVHSSTARMLNILSEDGSFKISWLGKNPKKDEMYKNIFDKLQKHVTANTHPELNPFFHFMLRTDDLEHELFRELYNKVALHYLKMPESSAWHTISADFATRFHYLDDETAKKAVERAVKEIGLDHFMVELCRLTKSPHTMRMNLYKLKSAYPDLAGNPELLKKIERTLQLSGIFQPQELSFIHVILKSKKTALGCDSFSLFSGE